MVLADREAHSMSVHREYPEAELTTSSCRRFSNLDCRLAHATCTTLLQHLAKLAKSRNSETRKQNRPALLISMYGRSRSSKQASSCSYQYAVCHPR